MRRSVLMLSVATTILAAPLVWGMNPGTVLADGSVAINEENFPDATFRDYVATKLDKTPGDGVLTDSDIAAIETVVLRNKGVKTLKGIEFFTNLINLRCDKNEITSLDISHNTKLDYLFCGYNNISSLQFGETSALTQLHCSDNRLTELNVKQFQNLKEFDCVNNSITSLDLSNLTDLYFVNCSRNLLTSLDVTGDTTLHDLVCKENFLSSDPTGKNTCTNLKQYTFTPQMNTTDRKAALDRRFFPDDLFCSYLADEGIDENNDGYLSNTELKNVTEIDCSETNIESLQGIKYFPSLKKLYCANTKIRQLDLSGLTKLEMVSAGYGTIEKLDVSGCTGLKYLFCAHNSIKELNMSGCKALENVDITFNMLTSMNVEDFENLQFFDCSDNLLTSLNVKNNSNLQYLFCYWNQLTTLQIVDCPKITLLDCSVNKLTSCPTVNADSIVGMSCASNPIEKLDMSALTKLQSFNCSNTKITELDLSGFTILQNLDCSHTDLLELNLFDCEELLSLDCSYCQIVYLSTYRCTDLREVKCEGNNLPLPPEVPDNCALTYEPQNDSLAPRKDFAVSSATNEMVTLSWKKEIYDQNWIMFKVYRSEDPEGEFEYIGMTGEDYYEDRLVEPGKVYYYKMCCYYKRRLISTTGDFTDVVSAKTPVAKPAQPANVKAVAESATSIKVSWDAVSDAAGYQVWRSTSANGTFTAIGSVTTTSRVSTGLTAGTKYYYKVRAYKEVDGKKLYGDYSDVVSAETLLAKPAGVKASAESTTSIKVSWSAVSGATGYQVSRSTSADGTFTSLGTVTTTSKVSTGLKAGTTYYYKVRAYKEVDGKKVYSAYSTVVSATTKLGTASNVKATSASATSIKVTWSAVSGATGYQVYRSTSADGTFASLGTVTATSKTSTGLKTGTTYYYKVRAYKEVDGKKIYGEYSKVVSAMPKPSAPTGVKAVSASATSVTVSWSKATGATGYEVYRATSADGSFSKLGAVTTTSRACAGLKTGTTYYFKVRSYVEVNGTKYYSGFSTVVSATPKK